MKILPKNITDLLEEFSGISDTKEKFEFLIELAEELPKFLPENKTPENKIIGCASDAWIKVETSPKKNISGENIIQISGIGDAVISKGILSFFIQCFHGLSAKEILDIQKNFPDIFIDSGVITSLSPSRANGAKAMLEKIYSECSMLV
jgi:cysteine desulfuration protein SufE